MSGRTARRLAAAGCVTTAFVALGLSAYAFYLARAYGSAGFRKSLLERASSALGTSVSASDVELGLDGVRLEEVVVANPPGFTGPLLTADAFVLRPRLLPFLIGRLEVRTLVLRRPVVALKPDPKGMYNYEKLGRRAAPGSAGATPLPLDLVFSRLAIEHGAITLSDSKGATLVKAQDASLSGSFRLGASGAGASGEARIETLSLADLLFVRQLQAPLSLAGGALALAPVRAQIAAGRVRGELRARTQQTPPEWTMRFELSGADVGTLLREARSKGTLEGRLEADASFHGRSGLASVQGKGQGRVADCRWKDARLLGMLAALMQLPELARPELDECRAEFDLARGTLHVTQLGLLGPQLRLAGRGTTLLASGALDFDMTLALDRRLLERIPAKEARAAFTAGDDGFATIDFKVTGTTQDPKTDLATRIAKASAFEVVKGGIGKLFGRKKSN